MSRPARPSLRRRLLLHLWGPLLGVLALGAFGGMVIARQVGYQVHDQWLLDSAMTLAAQVKPQGEQVVLALPPAAIQMFEWDRVDHIYWQAESVRQGRLLGNATLPPPPAPARPDTPQFYDAAVEGQPVRIVALEQRVPGGGHDTVRVLVGETMHKRESVAEKIFTQWAPLQLAVLLLAGTFIWLAVTRNLRKVDGIAARLGSYEADSLLPLADTEATPTEIVPLVHAMNRLIVKLRAEQASQKRFISNAAHQLRTPLATLRVQTQRVLRERDPIKHDQALDDVHRAVTRLHHVTHQLLILMRSEQQVEQHLSLAPVDLAALAREEVERWADSALANGSDLGYDGPESAIMVNGDAHLLHELIGNLIDNAIRYSGRSATVTLTLDIDPVRIAIDDDGPGILEDERALVMERFYRGAASDTAGGCGLGLPIAREIAARHGAKLAIASGSSGRGTRLVVTFPSGSPPG